MTPAFRNAPRCLTWLPCLVLLLSVPSLARAPQPKTESATGYTHYAIGDQAAPRPDPVEPGLLLNGGGEWPLQAFRWFTAKAGHGHLVILRASFADELQKEFYDDIGGLASAETFVFSDRRAASDRKVLAAIAKADAVFIAGGDQSNYVRYWKGTPLARALDRHVRAGRPIGGTSAGLAILGVWAYGAMDGGSMTPTVALGDPLGKGMTLVGDFLHVPLLRHVITDTHFSERQRLGRLIGFLAKLNAQGVGDVVGLGVDESASLCVDGDGTGRVYTYQGKEGYAWVVQPTRPPSRLEAGKPLSFEDIRITGVGPESRLHLSDFSIDSPAFHKVASVRDGGLDVRDTASSQSQVNR